MFQALDIVVLDDTAHLAQERIITKLSHFRYDKSRLPPKPT